MSPVEQDTIECEYLSYLFWVKKLKNKIKRDLKEILCKLLVRTLQYFFWKNKELSTDGFAGMNSFYGNVYNQPKNHPQINTV